MQLTLNVSTAFPPYRLSFECSYEHNPTGKDIPTQDQLGYHRDSWNLWNATAKRYSDLRDRNASEEARLELSALNFSLELFLDKNLEQPLRDSPPGPESGTRLFGRVQPSHQRE